MATPAPQLALKMLMRKPTIDDYPQILQLLDRAFAPSTHESALVNNLHDKRKLSFDFIIEEGCQLVAYICYSNAYDTERVKIGYHLAPVAVQPERQGKGLGHRIIADSLRAIGDSLPVYVLGNPAYYMRLGFKIDRTQKCIFDLSGDHFMVLNAGGPLPARHVGYEREFTGFLA